MLGKIIAVVLIIGLIALSTKLIVGLVKDIKNNNQQRKNAKSDKEKEIEK